MLVITVALPATAVGASVRSGQSSAPPVKVGMIYAVTSQIGGNPDARDAFQAAIKAFNKRGGAGTSGAKIEGIICDTRGDPNQEVACAREMVDEGVVATLNDLTYNNPAGVVEVLEAAGIPRIGIGPTNIAEFTSDMSYPISAGVIAAYIGTAVGFEEDGNTEICLVRTDAATGATFRGFIAPMFSAVGVEIICDVVVATGATDYTPYIAEVQRSNPKAMLISHTDEVGTQLIAAMAQLNEKLPMGGNPGTFDIDTLRKYKEHHEGDGSLRVVPVPLSEQREELPGAQAVLRRHEGVGEEEPPACGHPAHGLQPVDGHARVREGDRGSRQLHERDRRRGAQVQRGTWTSRGSRRHGRRRPPVSACSSRARTTTCTSHASTARTW